MVSILYHHVNHTLLTWTGDSLALCMPCRPTHFTLGNILGIRCVALRPALEHILFGSCRHAVWSYRSNGSECGKCIEAKRPQT